MATIAVDNREILAALARLQQRLGDLSPVFRPIGESLVDSTKSRFDTETDPLGYEWPGNSPLTIERKGFDKPLKGETGALRDTIDYRVLDNSLEVGSPMDYAEVHQFGGRSHWQEYDEIWEIPERPFLGLSREDKAMILHLVEDFLL